MTTRLIIEGLDEWRAVLKRSRQIVTRELDRTMRKATRIVEADAAKAAPVDTGRLRASINSRVYGRGTVVEGKVGSNVHYAPYMEYGTGALTDWPGGGKGAHFPPGGKLETWARRHGAPSGWAVAWAIFKRGGLKPRRYLRGALEKNTSRIQGQFDRALENIIRRLS